MRVSGKPDWLALAVIVIADGRGLARPDAGEGQGTAVRDGIARMIAASAIVVLFTRAEIACTDATEAQQILVEISVALWLLPVISIESKTTAIVIVATEIACVSLGRGRAGGRAAAAQAGGAAEAAAGRALAVARLDRELMCPTFSAFPSKSTAPAGGGLTDR